MPERSRSAALVQRVRGDVTAWALRQLPLRRRDQLVRLLNGPVAEHLPPSVGGLGQALGRALWCRYRELKPLGTDVAGRIVCLFAHYDRDGLIEDYVVHHLVRLQEAGAATVFITTAPRLDAAELRKIDACCAAVIHRDNVGIDFGSWRTGLLAYPQLRQCDTLIFANDSVYGPMSDLRAAIDRMAATDCDFWGATESLQIKRHYQSYFLAFRASCLHSAAFADYSDAIRLLADKDEVIRRYEVGMAEELRAGGLRGAALVPAAPDQGRDENPTLHRWREVLAAGSPYLKVQLLRENPHHQPISDWPEIVRSYGYDPELIARHLRRFAATGRAV